MKSKEKEVMMMTKKDYDGGGDDNNDDDNYEENVGLQNALLILLECIVSCQICFGIQLNRSPRDA